MSRNVPHLLEDAKDHTGRSRNTNFKPLVLGEIQAGGDIGLRMKLASAARQPYAEVTDAAIAKWQAPPRQSPGAQAHYSDIAIETALMLRL